MTDMKAETGSSVETLTELYDWLFRNFGVGPSKDRRGVAVPFETLEGKLHAMLRDRGVAL